VTEPIALADPSARDPAVFGDKSARLAQASAAGLPTLPGWVLPLGASEAAIAAGARTLNRSGPSAAYLAASEAPVPASVEEAAAASGGRIGSFVVRSSTVHDDDGRWSGAFASYLDVVGRDVPAAVRGCWASVFSRNLLARCGAMGVDVGGLRVGVLLQPFVAFEAGGTARMRPDRTAVVTAAQGGPPGVVEGRRGAVDITVGADGRCTGPIEQPLTRTLVRAAASLAHRAAAATGVGVIEWGAIGDQVLLLQVGPATPGPAAAGPAVALRASRDVPADAERLARLVTAFPGPLGEEFVLPWALALRGVPKRRPIAAADPASALAEAIALADELAAGAWGMPPAAARSRADAVGRSLREGRVPEALREIHQLRPADVAAGGRVIGLIDGIGAALVEAGVLPAAALVWRISRDQLDRGIAGAPLTMRGGPDRWEPFVAEVALARGRTSAGTPAADGVGAGTLHPVRRLRAIGRPGPRGVLSAPLPFPQLAPLLWHAAALVTGAGSTGAHLFEVARSLAVPAVIGVDLEGLAEADSLVAVDGSNGRVSVLTPAPSPVPAAAARTLEGGSLTTL
jgi:hypothetical protein